MQRGIIWGREVKMQGGPLSYLVYKREFDGDLALDLLAVYQRGEATVEEFLRFAWTMARTYDPEVSPYEAWLAEFDLEEFSVVDSPVGVIDSAINAELFRNYETSAIRRLARRIRRAVSRWLGALSRHIGSSEHRVLD